MRASELWCIATLLVKQKNTLSYEMGAVSFECMPDLCFNNITLQMDGYHRWAGGTSLGGGYEIEFLLGGVCFSALGGV